MVVLPTCFHVLSAAAAEPGSWFTSTKAVVRHRNHDSWHLPGAKNECEEAEAKRPPSKIDIDCQLCYPEGDEMNQSYAFQ